MNDLLGMLSQQMSGPVVDQISKQLGTDAKTTQSAVNAALPMLLGAISRNASSPQGAKSLDKALNNHDGSVLNDLLGAVTSQDRTADGAKILGHVLGNKQNNVQQGLSQLSGISADNSAQLLAMLAQSSWGRWARPSATTALASMILPPCWVVNASNSTARWGAWSVCWTWMATAALSMMSWAWGRSCWAASSVRNKKTLYASP
ncbi:MAG: DUF937 domain-containing protein [Caldilineaceae bacterium]